MSNPTHIHKKTGALVFPEGYKANQIRPITDAEWQDYENNNAMLELRQKRDELLSASDKHMLPDRGFSEAKRQEWIDYRQALRDITNTADPKKVTWPVEPKEK